MNELLLAHYLVNSKEDKRFRRWVLSSLISNTYYHNFVTHLREAWYQREVYKIIDAGGSVNADVLGDLFRKNLELFWGGDVEIPEGAELTWMRQPHYYMGLYSYTYSAGLTVATQAMLRIEKEGSPAVDDWKKFLSAGGTLPPVDLVKLAGFYITTDAPLCATIAYIGSLNDPASAMKTLAIMIGIQGSGKSTFCARYLSGLVRVNLDTLKTRNNEKRLIEKCFEEGVGFVVDNTNPTHADRARYIAPAKARGYRVIGYFMQSRLGDCIRRNNLRQGKERIPEKGIAATFRKLELPSREEGFDELYLVENDGADMTVSKWEEKTDSDAPRPKDPRP